MLVVEQRRAQGAVFTKQSQKEMLGLDGGTAPLAGIVPREENHPTGLFGEGFEHDRLLVNLGGPPGSCEARDRIAGLSLGMEILRQSAVSDNRKCDDRDGAGRQGKL